MTIQGKQFATAIALAGAVLFAPPVAADDVADFYKGKTMRIISGYGGGSSYSIYARALADNMGRHIPGNPTIVTTVMSGSGSLKAASYLFNAAPKDGATLGAIGRGVATEPLMYGKKSRLKFDPRKFIWLGSLNTEVSIASAWHTTGVKTMADARKTALFVPTGGATSDSAAFTFVTNALLGTKFKLVAGYRGGDSQNLALEQGEVQGRIAQSWSSVIAVKPDWIKDKKINILAQYAMAKHPDLPNVPLIIDLVSSAEDKSILAITLIRQEMGRPYVAPPGIPVDRAKALQTAFAKTIKDKRFLATAKKLRLEINKPRTGPEVAQLIERAFATPQSILDKVASAADRRNAKMTKLKKKKKNKTKK
jgi:tripartite-type tricarboxylate transporter receptor subunit TctC